MRFGYGDFGGLTHIIGAAVWGLFVLLMLAVFLTLAFLLARFLLIGTRAARIYVEKNGGETSRPATASAPTPAPTPAPSAPAATTASFAPEPATVTKPVPDASTAATTPLPDATVTKPTATRAKSTPAAKPASKPRTPKAPPTA